MSFDPNAGFWSTHFNRVLPYASPCDYCTNLGAPQCKGAADPSCLNYKAFRPYQEQTLDQKFYRDYYRSWHERSDKIRAENKYYEDKAAREPIEREADQAGAAGLPPLRDSRQRMVGDYRDFTPELQNKDYEDDGSLYAEFQAKVPQQQQGARLPRPPRELTPFELSTQQQPTQQQPTQQQPTQQRPRPQGPPGQVMTYSAPQYGQQQQQRPAMAPQYGSAFSHEPMPSGSIGGLSRDDRATQPHPNPTRGRSDTGGSQGSQSAYDYPGGSGRRSRDRSAGQQSGREQSRGRDSNYSDKCGQSGNNSRTGSQTGRGGRAQSSTRSISADLLYSDVDRMSISGKERGKGKRGGKKG